MPPALHDPALVLLSLIVVLALVTGARAAGAKGVPSHAIRKSLHVGVGVWTVLVTPRFHHLGWALVPPIVFLGVNALGKLRALVPSLSTNGGAASSRGLWTFPLGVALTYIFFWEPTQRSAILAGCATLALADPAAAIAGARFGQRKFHPFGHGRTLEGSLAFLIVAAAVVGWIAAAHAHAPGIPAWRLAIGCAGAGAAAEALSPPGWDNVAIPLVVAAAYRALA